MALQDSEKKAAVLFGMNYTKCDSSTQLRGCHNDADLMEKYLIESRGYSKENIKKCVDIDTPEALEATSRQGMIDSLYDLTVKSYKDDLREVFITYSGHGSQVRDYTGGGFQEEDNKNELILPWDFQTGGYILDNKIHSILKQMNPRTRVICIFDCCHSGSIADLEYKYAFDRHNNRVNYSQVKHNAMNANVITLSGCKDSQVSMDAYNVRGRRQFSGAMTACLTRVLEEERVKFGKESQPKLFEVFARLHDVLGDKDFVQMPVLFSSRILNTDDTF